MQEWDKIWAINKTIIDPHAPRYTAIVEETLAMIVLEGEKHREEE